MMLKTHLAITCFLVLLLLPFISDKIIFVVVALIITYIPDIDTESSKVGKKKIFRLVQLFTKHRGFFHSFTFLLLMTIILVLFFPILALGFFVGYSSHLIAYSFTIQGITPFFPWKKKSTGMIRTGSKTESFIFLIFLIADLLLTFRNILII